MEAQIIFDDEEQKQDFNSTIEKLDRQSLNVIEELFVAHDVREDRMKTLFDLKMELHRDTDDYLVDVANLCM